VRLPLTAALVAAAVLAGACSSGTNQTPGGRATRAAARAGASTPELAAAPAATSDGAPGCLLAADWSDGAAVLSVSRAESGRAGALLGTLGNGSHGGAIEVVVSPDGQFAFVSLEGSASIAVYNLQRALAEGFGRSDLVGMIPVALGPVGLCRRTGGGFTRPASTR
jgi:hypothetical protein